MANSPANAVMMTNPVTGVVEPVAQESANAALEQGWQVETPDERGVREYQEANSGSLVEGAKAFGEGAASAGTFGLYDAAAAGIGGDEYRKQRAARDETFWAPKVAGEVASYLVPGLAEAKALGTAGKVARVLGSPVSALGKGTSRVGGAVERLIAGAAPGTLRNIVAKGAGGLVQGATEGAAIGAGQAISESALQDKELSAELLLSHVRDGATIGGALGGTLGASITGLAALGRGAKGAAKYVPGIGEVLGSGGAKGIAETKALTSFGALGGDIKRLVKEKGTNYPGQLGRRIINEAGFAGEGAVGRAMSHDLDSAALVARERVESYGSELDDIHKRLDSSGERLHVGELTRDIDEKLLGPLRTSGYGGDARIARAIERDMRPLYERVERAEAVAAGRASLDGLKSKLDELQALKRLDPEAFGLRLAEAKGAGDAIKEHLASLGMRSAVNDIDAMIVGVERLNGGAQTMRVSRSFDRVSRRMDELVAREGTPTMSYEQARALRGRIDKDIKQWDRNADPRASSYRDLRELFKARIAEQAEKTGLGEQFKAANAGMSEWLRIAKLAEERAGMAAGNRSVGLTDTLMAGTGASLGATFGGGIGAGLGSVAGTAANKFIRSAAADRLASTLANRFAGIRSAARATDDAAIKLGDASERLVRGRRFRPTAVGLSTRLGIEYESARNRTIERQNNRQRMTEQLMGQISRAGETAPELASATIRAASRGADLINKSVPIAPGYEDLHSRANPEAMAPPESEQIDWLRQGLVLEQPSKLLEETRKGTVTPDQVAKVQEAYPSLYRAMASNVTRAAADAAAQGKTPSYQQTLALSMLTGAPLDASTRPEVIATYQAIYASGGLDDAKPQQVSGASGKAPRYATRRENLTDREV